MSGSLTSRKILKVDSGKNSLKINKLISEDKPVSSTSQNQNNEADLVRSVSQDIFKSIDIRSDSGQQRSKKSLSIVNDQLSQQWGLTTQNVAYKPSTIHQQTNLLPTILKVPGSIQASILNSVSGQQSARNITSATSIMRSQTSHRRISKQQDSNSPLRFVVKETSDPKTTTGSPIKPTGGSFINSTSKLRGIALRSQQILLDPVQRQKLIMLEKINIEYSDDETIAKPAFFPSKISTKSRAIEKQFSAGNPPQPTQSEQAISNPIFDRVYMNDLPGLKRTVEGLQTFFERKKKLNLKDQFMRTSLYYSLYHQSFDMVDYLISTGSDTLQFDHKGRTPLHYACILDCDKKIIQLLVDYNKEMDEYKAHTKESAEEFKERPIKNYDTIPTMADLQKPFNEREKISPSKIPTFNIKDMQSIGKQTKKLRSFINNKIDDELNSQLSPKPNGFLTRDEEEKMRKIKFERKLKKSVSYIEGLINYVNLVDHNGLTPLHYAVRKNNLQNIKCLISNNASLYIRDYKMRTPRDMTDNMEVILYLDKEKTEFEKNYAKLNSIQNDNKKELFANKTPSKQDTMKFLQKRRLIINQKNLSSKNNAQLSSYIYGLYQDNVLSFLIRINDTKTLIYILARGASPLAQNDNDQNAVHYAIMLEKFQFLSYFFEGDFDGYKNNDIDNKYQKILNELLNNERHTKRGFIIQAFTSLDRCSKKQGHTPLHLALKQENDNMALYIIQLIQIREMIRKSHPDIFGDSIQRLQDIISFRNVKSKTSLLIAAQYGHIQSFQILLQLGSNFYSQCIQLNNVLHYSLMSENVELVKFVSHSDAENSTGSYLHMQKNVRGMVPLEYDIKKQFSDTINHIWEAASNKSSAGIDRVSYLLKSGIYNSNDLTIQGKNTPLHFAVVNSNLKVIQILTKQSDIDMNLRNSEGMTALDYAQLIPSLSVKAKIINMLQTTDNINLPKGIIIDQETQEQMENTMTLMDGTIGTNSGKASPLRGFTNQHIVYKSDYRINEQDEEQVSKYIEDDIQQVHKKNSDLNIQLNDLLKQESSETANTILLPMPILLNVEMPTSLAQSADVLNKRQAQIADINNAKGRNDSENTMTAKSSNAQELLQERINQHQDLARYPEKLIGKFPIEIFKKWYEQHNQMNHKEQDKLSELYNTIQQHLQQRWEKAQTTMSHYQSKKYMISDQYLTYQQITEFCQMIEQKLEMSYLQKQNFKEFLMRYYSTTKISKTEFVNNLMKKFKLYQKAKQQL